MRVTLDHCVVHVSDWDRSNAFYQKVLGAELVRRPKGFAYRFGGQQLNLHGPGFVPAEVARLPVQPRSGRLAAGIHQLLIVRPIGRSVAETVRPDRSARFGRKTNIVPQKAEPPALRPRVPFQIRQ